MYWVSNVCKGFLSYGMQVNEGIDFRRVRLTLLKGFWDIDDLESNKFSNVIQWVFG